MKILHVAATPAKAGGSIFALRNILIALEDTSIESEVLSVANTNTPLSLVDFIPQHTFAPSFPARFTNSKAAIAWLRQNARNFDFISIHGIWAFFPLRAAAVARSMGIPYCISPHGSLDPIDLQKKSLAKKLLGPVCVRPALDGAEFISCTSKREADKLVTYGSAVPKISVSLPVPVPEDQGDRSRFRAQYHYEPEDFVLLSLSRIDYGKGLDLLIPALAEIIDEFPNAKLMIAGEGAPKCVAEIEEIVTRYHLETRVIFCGMLSGSDKLDAFSGSDLFVLPSMKENFGISVVEALNLALPVLVSNQVYIWDMVVPQGGWVCDYSVASVVTQLRHILSDRLEYQGRKAAARSAAAEFAAPVLAPQYEKLYCTRKAHLL